MTMTVWPRRMWAGGVSVAVLGVIMSVSALAAHAVSRPPKPAPTWADAPATADLLPSPQPERTVAVVAPSAKSIGVLSHSADLRTHGCTASVVASTSGEVIVTAAHCLSGTGRGLLFAPGYRSGTAPYGVWVVQSAYVAPGWLTGQDPQTDYAFLTVRPAASNKSAATVQAVVGGYRLAGAPRAGDRARITGYVAQAATSVSCSATIYVTHGYPGFDCDGFAGGTSGGPWIEGGTGVTGVIGGLHQGGCSPDTSYSSAFNAVTAATLTRAEHNQRADVLPAPGPDGC